MIVLFFLHILASAAAVREYTDEEISNFPKLFHLDDYERCLAKRDGLYCLGVFDLSPDGLPNPRYDLLKEYSKETHRHFNRTRIHRGYCVSSRCPNDDGNSSQRFERCVDNYARSLSLRASTRTLQYCHTSAERRLKQPRTAAQDIFSQCVFALIVINIIGTIYDIYTGDSTNKNKYITAFSISANWRTLTVIKGDSRFQALDGIRVVAMAFTIFAHCNYVMFRFYSNNPEVLEQHTQRLDGIYISDGTSVIQGFLSMSRFLTCYNLLLVSKKRPLSLSTFPRYIYKRIIRITPVHLLLVGFEMTWWPLMRDGPLVPTNIDLESSHCQSKFWYHVFYVNNMVDRNKLCMVPTWFLPVDMHTYIVATLLTLIMWRYRNKAIKIYVMLLIATCVLNGVVSYLREYTNVVFIYTPEIVRGFLRESPSYTEFYLSSWSALPNCFVGLIFAHIQFELDEKRINLSQYKLFVYLSYIMFPVCLVYGLKGIFIRNYGSPLFNAAYIAVDNPFFCFLICVTVLGLINVDNPIKRILSWRGFTFLVRLSLPVMIAHWCFLMTISAKPYAYSVSFYEVITNWAATCLITYILAIPISVLVEIPVQTFMELLVF